MLKFTLYILCCSFLFFNSSIGFSQKTNLQFLNELKTRKDFDDLKGKPLSNNYNGIECVKIVYVLATKKLYYIESVRYNWHYMFTSQVLFDDDFLDVFNAINYSQSSGRKYILATFNYNTNTKNYFFRGKPQTPNNQNPSPRGYRLTTNSPEADVAAPVGDRIASVDAV